MTIGVFLKREHDNALMLLKNRLGVVGYFVDKINSVVEIVSLVTILI
jgi:hypothetical protein